MGGGGEGLIGMISYSGSIGTVLFPPPRLARNDSAAPLRPALHGESLLSKQRVIRHYLLCLGIFLRPKVAMTRVCPKSAEACLAQDVKRAICCVRHAERDCGIMVCVVQVAVHLVALEVVIPQAVR